MPDGVRMEVKAKPRREMLRVAMFDHSSLIVQGITVEEECHVRGGGFQWREGKTWSV